MQVHRLAALALVPPLLLSACSLLEDKYVLQPRGSFREGAPEGEAQVHLPGIGCELECAYVEEEQEMYVKRGFQVTFFVQNDSPSPLEIDWKRIDLIDDRDARYTMSSALRWNEDEERYDPAPAQLAPGARETLVALFPVEGRINLQHLFRVTLRWGYGLGAETRRIRSPFTVR
jgi:hypothetical protein